MQPTKYNTCIHNPFSFFFLVDMIRDGTGLVSDRVERKPTL
jgi:hypothetical protein